MKYSKYVSKDVIKEFLSNIKRFERNGINGVATLYRYCLGDKFLELVQKYLDLSINKDVCFLAQGSSSVCFRVGDYVFKIVKMKWSYEDVICPNLFLIHKNLEEYLIRDSSGVVVAGFEVQKYLPKSAKGIDIKYLSYFTNTLAELGFYSTDTLMNGKCGDNCRILDSYQDADIINVDVVPDWFKEIPLVLIDRDCIYPKEKKLIRQLRMY